MMLLKVEVICKRPVAEGRELNFVQIRDITLRIYGMYQAWQGRPAIPMYALEHLHCLSMKCSVKIEIWQLRLREAAAVIHSR